MWTLKLAKEAFKFSGAHFTTFSKDKAESLHGHNYYVSVVITGHKTLDHGLITDLNRPKAFIQSLLDTLDEKVLIAQNNPYTHIHISQRNVEISFSDKFYSFPKQDCALLEIENVSMEALSEYVAQKLEPEFKSLGLRNFSVEVSESRGQAASYHVSLGGK